MTTELRVAIDMLDNPGGTVTIDLHDTSPEQRAFERIDPQAENSLVRCCATRRVVARESGSGR
jgi:immunity protein 53 of polymorphic toxin system